MIGWMTAALALSLTGPTRATWAPAPDVPVQIAQTSAPKLCANCTYVDTRRDLFIQTDSAGTRRFDFHCGENAVTRTFCENAELTQLGYVEPRVEESCRHLHSPHVCYQEDVMAVTLWSDERVDVSVPHSVTLSTEELAEWRSGVHSDIAPEDQSIFREGESRVYAHYGSSIFRTLIGQGWGDPNKNLAKDNNLIVPVLEFANNNPQLVLYTGHRDEERLAVHGWCPEAAEETGGAQTGLFPQCAGIKLLKYVTQHRDVQTLPMIDKRHISFSFEYTTDPLTPPHRDQLVRQFCCTRPQLVGAQFCPCASDILDVETFKASTSAGSPPLLMNTGFNGNSFQYKTYTWRVTFNGTITDDSYAPWPYARYNPVGIATVYFPVAHNTTAYVRYPFMMLWNSYVRDRCSRIQWVEESEDGLAWTVHPESANETVVDMIEKRNLRSLVQYLESAEAFRRPVNGGLYVRSFANTGQNRYMRVAYGMLLGKYACPNALPNTPANADFYGREYYFPRAVLYANRRDKTRVTVLPSPTSGLNSRDSTSVTGLDRCRTLPLCDFLEDAPKVYPSDFALVSGSRDMRDYVSGILRPLLFGSCERIVPDPVRLFLNAPAFDMFPAPGICYRVSESIAERRCFLTTLNTRPVISPVIETDVLRTSARYLTWNGTLSVYTQRLRGSSHPTPQAVMGRPFTHVDMTPVLYVYKQPVKGSRHAFGRFITTRESCEFADPGELEAMAEDPTCECMHYPLSPTHCLCAPAGETYRTTGSIPAGLTFALPGFFNVLSVPVNYTLVRRQLLFDSGVYTRIDVDCASFLCSNMPGCLQVLEKSNFLSFCENQRSILRATLASLSEGRDLADRQVEEFVRKYPTRRDEDLSERADRILRQDNISRTPALPNETFGDSFNQYYGVHARQPLKVELPGKGMPSASYVNPETKPWESVATLFFPLAAAAINSGRLNQLAYDDKVQDAKIQAVNFFSKLLAKDLNLLTEGLRKATDLSAQAMGLLVTEHNDLVLKVNDRFETQREFNVQLAAALNQVNRDVTANINFVDLAASRAATLAVQSSAIMVKALDYELRSRRFAQRVRACTAAGSDASNAVECADVTGGILLSALVRREDSMNLIESLVLVPDAMRAAYATPEFCHEGTHYAVTTDDDVFVVHEGRMMITSTQMWLPRNITLFNTVRTPCTVPELVVTSLTPDVPVVPLDLTTAVKFRDAVDLFDVDTLSESFLPAIDLHINVNKLLDRLNQAIGAIQDYAFTSLSFVTDPDPVVEGFFSNLGPGLLTGLNIMGNGILDLGKTVVNGIGSVLSALGLGNIVKYFWIALAILAGLVALWALSKIATLRSGK